MKNLLKPSFVMALAIGTATPVFAEDSAISEPEKEEITCPEDVPIKDLSIEEFQKCIENPVFRDGLETLGLLKIA